MSDEHDLDLAEQIARIKRAQLESDKFVTEQRKLIAEAQKLDKERWWFPLLQIITAIAAIVAAIAALSHR